MRTSFLRRLSRSTMVFRAAIVLTIVLPLHMLFAASGQTTIGVTVVSDSTAPSVPIGLSATAMSSSQIDLSWTASTDNVAVTGYRIYRDGSIVASTSGTTYSSTGLSASTQYSFTVEAYDAIPNYSGQSATAYATTSAPSGGGGGGGDTTPPTVSSFTPSNGAIGVAVNAALTIAFSEPIRKLSGDIRIKRYADDATIETIPVTSGQVVIVGSSAVISPSSAFSQDTRYYIEADTGSFDDQSSNAFAGFSGNATWSFTTVDNAPPAIFGVSVTPSTSTAAVSWSTDEAAQGSFRWGTTTDLADGTIIEGGYGTVHSASLSDLSPSTLYHFRIVERDASGNSATTTGTFTTSALPDTTPPSNVTGLSATPSLIQVLLSWTNPIDPDFSAVRVLRKVSGYPTSPIDGTLVYDGPGTSVTDIAVSTSTTYYYTVFARDTVANYSSGAIVSATVPTDVTPPPPPPPPPGEEPPPPPPPPPTGGGSVSTTTPTSTPPTVLPPTTTPFDLFPPMGELPPLLRSLSFDDFEVYQLRDERRIQVPVIRSVAKIDGDAPFVLSVPKENIPDSLSAIAVTLRHPSEGDFSFMLQLNPEENAYEATVGELEENAKFPVTISVLDVDSRTSRVVSGILDVNYRSPEPTNIIEAALQVVNEVKEPIQNIAPVVTPVGVAVGASEIVLVTTNIRSFYDLYMFFLKLVGLISGVFRKRKRDPWGVVYDSVTKRPLDPAYVVAQDDASKHASGEAITDLDGRYGFILKPGHYVIVANKTHYRFPSKQLLGKGSDEFYDNLYFGETLDVKEGQVARYNIPLDPIEFDWNEFAKNKDKVFKVYSKKENIRLVLFNTLFFIGVLFSFGAAYLEPSTLNIVMCTVYTSMFVFQMVWKKRHHICQVRAKDGKPIPFALVKVYLSGTTTMVKKVVADELGRFYFLVPPGNYIVTVEEKLPDASYRKVLETGALDLKRGVLRNDLVVA